MKPMNFFVYIDTANSEMQKFLMHLSLRLYKDPIISQESRREELDYDPSEGQDGTETMSD